MLTSVIGGKSPQRFIKCQAAIALQYNSLAVAALVDRLEYWFERSSNKFYKFLSPCSHYHYRVGDSWCEELGMTPDVFRRAFSKIGIAYKSYSKYRDAVDKFQGYAYASYYNRQSRQTYFFKNPGYKLKNHQSRDVAFIKPAEPFINIFQDSLNLASLNQSSNYSNPVPCQTNSDPFDDIDLNDTKSVLTVSSLAPNFLSMQKESSYPQSNVQEAKNTVSRKPCFTVSPIRMFNISQKRHSISFKEKESVNKVKKKAFSSHRHTPADPPARRYCLNKHLSQQMIAIWQDVIGDPKLRFTSNTLLNKLSEALEQHFADSLFIWREYCLKIASSKFLMGESKAWILKDGVYLIWAIRDENIAKVQSNRISTGDRVLKLSANQQALNQERIQIREKIKELEIQLEDPKRQVQMARHRQVIGKVNDLLAKPDDSVLARYQDQFEAAVNQGTGSTFQQLTEPLQKAIISRAWRAGCRARKGRGDNPWWYFINYLVEVLATQHFGLSEAQMSMELEHQIIKNLISVKATLSMLDLQYLNKFY